MANPLVPGVDPDLFEVRISPYYDDHSVNLLTDPGGTHWRRTREDLEQGEDASIFGRVPGYRFTLPGLGTHVKVKRDPEDALVEMAEAAEILGHYLYVQRDGKGGVLLTATPTDEPFVLRPELVKKLWAAYIADFSDVPDTYDMLWEHIQAVDGSPRSAQSNPRRGGLLKGLATAGMAALGIGGLVMGHRESKKTG